MSWRWLIDTRGDKVLVDWPRLSIAVAGGLAFASVLLWAVPSPWDYALLVVLLIVGITIDVRSRGGRSRA